jgi:hypothetical protein
MTVLRFASTIFALVGEDRGDTPEHTVRVGRFLDRLGVSTGVTNDLPNIRGIDGVIDTRSNTCRVRCLVTHRAWC